MKRVSLMLGILALLLLLAVAGVLFAADTRDTLFQMSAEAAALIEQDDADALYRQAQKMSAFVEGRQSILSLYVRHDELEKLQTQLVSLEAQAKSGDTDVSIILAQIEYLANHIYERELPGIDNLL